MIRWSTRGIFRGVKLFCAVPQWEIHDITCKSKPTELHNTRSGPWGKPLTSADLKKQNQTFHLFHIPGTLEGCMPRAGQCSEKACEGSSCHLWLTWALWSRKWRWKESCEMPAEHRRPVAALTRSPTAKTASCLRCGLFGCIPFGRLKGISVKSLN